MDSSIPPSPPSLGLRKLRPWYLVPTMVLTWCVGVRGLMDGCASIVYLRSATLPDVATATRNAEGTRDVQDLLVLFNAVMLEGVHRLERITFPLSLAQAMVAMMLVLASGLAMGSRPGARLLAVQALVANALLVGVTYVLTRSIRAASIDAVGSVVQTISADLPRALLPTREMLWWHGRILVTMEIGALLLGALALTRPRLKAYFDAVARAAESAKEP